MTSAAPARSAAWRNIARSGICCWRRWPGFRSSPCYAASALESPAPPYWSRKGRSAGRLCRPRSAWYRGPGRSRVALVVVIDELDRPAEQPAFGVDVVAPDRSPASTCLPIGATPPVSAMVRPTLMGSAALAAAATNSMETANKIAQPRRLQWRIGLPPLRACRRRAYLRKGYRAALSCARRFRA